MKKVVIVEGFDMVGKSTYIKDCLGFGVEYYPIHDLTDKTIGREKSWVIGYSILDMISQVKDVIKKPIIVNRGVFSSYVYSILFQNTNLDENVIDYYKNSDFFHNEVEHIYVRHSSKESARVVYEKSQKRGENGNELSSKYDKYDSFEDYWKAYTEADALFIKSYCEIGIIPTTVQSDALSDAGEKVWDIFKMEVHK